MGVCSLANYIAVYKELYYVPIPLPKGGGTYCFLGLIMWHWHQRQRRRRRKTSCPLCNLNTLWNIFMTLGRNVEQDKRMCHVKRMTILAFILLELFPFVLFEIDFVLVL